MLTPDGVDHTEGDAAVMLLEELRWTRWIGRGCRLLRLQWLLGAMDGLVGRLRPRLGRFVRNQPGPERYP